MNTGNSAFKGGSISTSTMGDGGPGSGPQSGGGSKESPDKSPKTRKQLGPNEFISNRSGSPVVWKWHND